MTYNIFTGETTILLQGTSECMYYPLAWTTPDSLLVGRMSSADLPVAFFECNPQDPSSLPQSTQGLPRHMDRNAVTEIIPEHLSLLFRRTDRYAWSGRGEVWVASSDGATAYQVADDAASGQRPLWRPGYDSLKGTGP